MSSSTRSNTASKSTFWLRPSLSVSCTTAIAATRRIACVSDSRASSECERRAWIRSSDATVCRLFFTRWWISRIVASLVSNSCSWCRSSVTSRHSTMAPTRSPRSRIGIDRSDTVTPRASMSVRHGARPVTTSGSDSSTVQLARQEPGRHLGQRFALELTVEAHPVERRQPVGAREGRRCRRRRAGSARRMRAARRAADRPAPRGRGSRPTRSCANRSFAHSLKVSS